MGLPVYRIVTSANPLVTDKRNCWECWEEYRGGKTRIAGPANVLDCQLAREHAIRRLIHGERR
jgi:hypothetical protein